MPPSSIWAVDPSHFARPATRFVSRPSWARPRSRAPGASPTPALPDGTAQPRRCTPAAVQWPRSIPEFAYRCGSTKATHSTEVLRTISLPPSSTPIVTGWSDSLPGGICTG